MKHFLILGITTLLTVTLCAQTTTQVVSTQLKPFLNPLQWSKHSIPQVNREIIMKSLDAARNYFLTQQKKDGNFTYAMDIASGETADDDNQVRQAGALWGLISLHRDFPTEQTRQAIVRGLDFVSRNTRQLKTGETVFVYPGEDTIKTGTIALLCLSITDFLKDKSLPDHLRQHYRRLLFSYLAYLRTMELPNGSWARCYELSIGFRDPSPSPYYDGETMLAYSIVARELKRKDLQKRVIHALPHIIKRYTLDAWALDGDDDLTKGFYQWGSMACQQIVQANWQPVATLAADAAIAMAWWQLFQNQAESKRGNMSYAVEGLVAAYNIAHLTQRTTARDIIGPAIKRIMGKLTICQFHGPLMHLNPKFNSLTNPALSAIGGITEHKNSTIVRIDTVQHQVHALLLMLKYMDF